VCAAGGGRCAGRASRFPLARNCGSPGPVSAVASDSRTTMMRRASACRNLLGKLKQATLASQRDTLPGLALDLPFVHQGKRLEVVCLAVVGKQAPLSRKGIFTQFALEQGDRPLQPGRTCGLMRCRLLVVDSWIDSARARISFSRNSSPSLGGLLMQNSPNQRCTKRSVSCSCRRIFVAARAVSTLATRREVSLRGAAADTAKYTPPQLTFTGTGAGYRLCFCVLRGSR